MKVRDVIKKIEDDGWRLARTRGSHRQYHHQSKPGPVTIFRSSVSGSSTGNFEQHSETGRSQMKYLVIYEKSESGWGAYVPDLPGLGVAGSTLDEVKQLIREAIDFHLEGMREHGDLKE